MERQKIFPGFCGYLKYIRENRRRIFFFGILFFPATVVGNYLSIYLPAMVVRELEQGRTVTHLVMAMSAVLACLVFCRWLSVRMQIKAENENLFLVQRMQNAFTKKLLYVDYKYLEDKKFLSLRNMVRASLFGGNIGDAERRRLCDFVVEAIRLVAAAGNVLLYAVYVCRLSPWLILLVLIIIPSVVLFNGQIVGKNADRMTQQAADAWQKLDYITRKSEDFGMAKDVRLYAMEQWFYSLSDKYCKERLSFKGKEMRARGLGDCLLHLAYGIYYAVFSGCILYRFWEGNLQASDVVFYAGLAPGFFHMLDNGISGGVVAVSQISVDFHLFLEFLSYGEDTGLLAVPVKRKTPEIVLEHVSFTYPEGNRKILDDVSLTVRPGEKLAVVGVNGAGKTTLMKLICGLLHPTEGRLLLDGRDMEQMEASERYAWFSCVFQDIQFLPLSLRENIAMLPKGEADDARVWECLEQAGMKEAVEQLPQKLDTLLEKTINEEAVDFSGGQRQKLILARALYRGAGILILDEPTAALDALAEKAVYESYREFAGERTTFFISHRLAGTTFCDRLLLLDGGRIAEQGTHRELLAAGGLYAKMFALQSKYYQEGQDEKQERREQG